MSSYPRRDFILAVLAACGSPLFAGTAFARGQRPAAPPDSNGVQTAIAYFGGMEPALAVGEAFLEHLGLDRTAASIREAARTTLSLIEQAGTPRTALTALTRAVHRDFEERRTVELHGWVLSRTEGELCALIMLAHPN